MGYMERWVDRCTKEGNLGTRVVGNIGSRTVCGWKVCGREGDAGHGNPWWVWLKVGSRSAYKEGRRKGGSGGAWRMRGGRDSVGANQSCGIRPVRCCAVR